MADRGGMPDLKLTPSKKKLKSVAFENEKGEPVEINFQNFQQIMPGGERSDLVRVKFKDGREEWVKATATAVLEAAVEE
jgi:hypothetical protein